MLATNTDSANGDQLLPFKHEHLQAFIPGKKNPITWWRWCTKGVAGLDGERIKLKVWYVGRTPHTSVNAVRSWLDAVIAARTARMSRTSQRSLDVSAEDMESVGL